MADQPQVFKYRMPVFDKPKTVVRMCTADTLYCDVQVGKKGSANNLHAHTGIDGIWFVLSGRVKFYGRGDAVIAELGKHEGLLIPHGFPYWFESVGEESLEMLNVACTVPGVEDRRVDYTAQKEWQKAPVSFAEHAKAGGVQRKS